MINQFTAKDLNYTLLRYIFIFKWNHLFFKKKRKGRSQRIRDQPNTMISTCHMYKNDCREYPPCPFTSFYTNMTQILPLPEWPHRLMQPSSSVDTNHYYAPKLPIAQPGFFPNLSPSRECHTSTRSKMPNQK